MTISQATVSSVVIGDNFSIYILGTILSARISIIALDCVHPDQTGEYLIGFSQPVPARPEARVRS